MTAPTSLDFEASAGCECCGEPDVDQQGCAGCGKWCCDECIDWCCLEHDEANGDWFCKDCQEN